MDKQAPPDDRADRPTQIDLWPTPLKEDTVEREVETVLQEMKVTKGSRFNAAERLRKKDRLNTIATTYLSIVVIIIAISGLAYHLPDWLQNATNLATIILSIFIVVFSLLQYSSGDAVKAELHHRCATEINGLRRRLRCSLALGNPIVEHVSSEYDAVLQKYGANHEPIDFETYKLEHPNEYPLRSEPTVSAMRKDVARSERGFAQSVVNALSGLIVSSLILILVSQISEYFRLDLMAIIGKILR